MLPAIAIRHLARSFGARRVLEDVTLDIPHGAVACVLGANGSGKTTLLEILATLLLPTRGQAFVHGLDVSTDGAAVRRIAGYGLSNLQTFYPQLSGRLNLQFIAAVYGLDPRQARRRAASLLEALGLSGAAEVRVQEYSDGMKARLSMARALLADPPVLLLDEPTKSLDEAGRLVVRDLAFARANTREPRTVVWTTHDYGEAVMIGDVVRVLVDGELREPAAYLLTPRHGQAVPA